MIFRTLTSRLESTLIRSLRPTPAEGASLAMSGGSPTFVFRGALPSSFGMFFICFLPQFFYVDLGYLLKVLDYALHFGLRPPPAFTTPDDLAIVELEPCIRYPLIQGRVDFLGRNEVTFVNAEPKYFDLTMLQGGLHNSSDTVARHGLELLRFRFNSVFVSVQHSVLRRRESHERFQAGHGQVHCLVELPNLGTVSAHDKVAHVRLTLEHGQVVICAD